MFPADSLRLCDVAGCTWHGQHAENCSACYGFGWMLTPEDRTPHIIAVSDLVYWFPRSRAIACSLCEGTPLGRMDKFEAHQAHTDPPPAT